MRIVKYKIQYSSKNADGEPKWIDWTCDGYIRKWSESEHLALLELRKLREADGQSNFRLQKHETIITDIET